MKLTWIIKVKMKDGMEALFAADRKGHFALCFPDQDGEYFGFLAWESHVEAESYLRKQLAVAPQLSCLKPFLVEQMTVYAPRKPRL